MKLVNPVGREVSTFETQANYYCPCICSSGAYTTKYDAAEIPMCGCRCNGSSSNDNANDSTADSKL